MLKILFLFICLVSYFTTPVYGSEFEEMISFEGILKEAEINVVKGENIIKVQKHIFLIPDQSFVFFNSIKTGEKRIFSEEKTYSYIEVSLPEEFRSLIGKHVRCWGAFRQFDYFKNTPIFDVNLALESDVSINSLVRFFYEQEELEVSGVLYKETYPGPPEYMDVQKGDQPEEVIILALKEPINIDSKAEDDFNYPEKAVFELHVIGLDSLFSEPKISEELSLKGSLYHAHTAHHRRRVLFMVKSWEDNKKSSRR